MQPSLTVQDVNKNKRFFHGKKEWLMILWTRKIICFMKYCVWKGCLVSKFSVFHSCARLININDKIYDPQAVIGRSHPSLLRIFSRMSRTRHASQTTKVNMMLKVQTFSTRKERESVWHHGIAVDPGLLGNVTQWRDSANIQSLWELRSDFTLLNARWPLFFFP